MNCPYCNHKDHLEIDLHADGFSADLLECSTCGAVLTTHCQKLETVHGPTRTFGVGKLNVLSA